jgi:hypothetical protein
LTRRGAPLAIALALAAATGATPAWAHHGTAAVGALGAEGPGAALDTASPLPLGPGTFFALVKSEYVPFQQLPGFSDQKQYALYDNLAVGYGLTPWLSAFVFQPYNVKAQDGIGTNHGLGDTNLMLSASFKWDDGFQRTPEKESLDDLTDWHFGAWASCTLPVGATTHVDDHGDYYAADMQTGFRGPSPALGLTLLKQVSPDFTVLAELNHQHFFEQHYSQAGYHYQFGGETRLNGALVYRAWAGAAGRIDVAAEGSLLDLQRDKTDQGGGPFGAMQASGGTILYGQLGARAYLGPVSVGLLVKRALARSLNEQAQQQGSEGLEQFRAALVIGYAVRP